MKIHCPLSNPVGEGVGGEDKKMINSLKKLAIQTARELRKNQTETEKIFWEEIRNRKFLGLKFRRQEPIYYEFYEQKKFFICDFICPGAKLIIEIDGGIHEKQKEYDKTRKEILKLKEYQILRFKNEDILNNLEGVLIQIKSFLKNELKIKD